jgi:hypothetical protein
MKRFALLVAAVVAIAAIAGLTNLASAGDYHVGRLLICSDCHIAHGSQKHGYATDADTTWQYGTGTPPFAKLLRGETVSNACLNCHDGKPGIADVLQGNTNSSPHGRSAGALNVPNGGAHGYGTEAPYTQGDGHTLWAPGPPPGFSGSTGDPTSAPLVSADGLECSDCHRVHGSKYFRNMAGAPNTGSIATYFNSLWRGTEVEYEIAPTPTQPPTKWVLEKAPRNYDNDNVQYLEKSDQASSEYGKWCSTCHTNFHGAETDVWMQAANGDVGRHPTKTENMSSLNSSGVLTGFTSWAITDPTHRLKVLSQTGAWAATAAAMPTNLTPSCVTCHKSHGNANKFGLIFVMSNRPASTSATSNGLSGSNAPAGSNAILMDPIASANMTEEGDGGQYRDMCRNCHGMGSWPLTGPSPPGTGNPTNIIP